MKYHDNNRLWDKLRERAALCGWRLDDLDALFGLDGGMLEYMAANGVVPEGELLRRISMFSGLSRAQLLGGGEKAKCGVRRGVFVIRDAEGLSRVVPLESVIKKIFIDLPSGDSNSYVAVVMSSESMKRAHIYPGDTLIIRRQAVAADGDIVAVGVGGKTLIRRAHKKHGVLWFEAEGTADDGPVMNIAEPSGDEATVYGKVISAVRFFDD